MARRVAQPGDTVDTRQAIKQAREPKNAAVFRFASIGVDILPQQRDLSHACIGKLAYLLLDVSYGTRIFRAARIGHDTECAEFVTALLDGDKGRYPARNCAC